MVKQGYMRTAEAVIAVVITFSILTLLIRQDTVTESRRIPSNVLDSLKYDSDFRACVESKNTACINDSINAQLPDSYQWAFNLSEEPNVDINITFPTKRIVANAVVLAGNATNSTIRIVRLFYWTK